MAESSPILDGRSRKTLAAILQGLARVGQVEVAKATGKSETWISRAKDDDLKTCAILLTACGLKVFAGRFEVLHARIHRASSLLRAHRDRQR
jgi:hypothetical protein